MSNRRGRVLNNALSDEGSESEDYEYEVSDNEDSEEEEILHAFHQHSEDSSSEEEVLAIRSESDEGEEELDNDDESSGNENDDELPSTKAWGKKKKTYYNTDYNVNDRNGFQNEEEEEMAKLEEKEGLSIQKRLLSEVDGADLSVDLFENEKGAKVEGNDKIQEDISKAERKRNIEKQTKEFFEIYKDYMNAALMLLIPQLELVSEYRGIGRQNKKIMLDFIKDYVKLIQAFGTNFALYMKMEYDGIDLITHPITDKLKEYKQLIFKFNDIYVNQISKLNDKETQDRLLSDVLELSERMNTSCAPVNELIETLKSNTRKRYPTDSSFTDEEVVKTKKVKSDGSKKKGKGNTKKAEEDASSDSKPGTSSDKKRSITYEMAKNKGLTPRRKKELRNPRVKHKLKYRKAKIRRKGQVREVRRELKRYTGEASGINPHVSKSIKLK